MNGRTGWPWFQLWETAKQRSMAKNRLRSARKSPGDWTLL
jgi:hypothetical protein